MGTYDHAEMSSLLIALSKRSECAPDDVLQRFGFHLADRFALLFPAFFTRAPNFFTFLASVDDHIHVEVQKLYPDAELPSFDVMQNEGSVMTMRYRSSRKMEALAEGLILGCARHFERKIVIQKNGDADGSTIFVVTEIKP